MRRRAYERAQTEQAQTEQARTAQALMQGKDLTPGPCLGAVENVDT